ncbi:aldo/keto reductase [Solirubrobacter ginsenosidimutans]|uniref:Aldo/keto reductase n=1 Tax=Solirubrobacter ginsenosidimutans TaxID=490573 RepID=A0A9X3MQM8_9ACTN|nr:aldo/keto reductase [Solirubrobacter ginsenosidimutans]MDA0159425.1 aldo/keto reductase [Solirubrobacter ginsenosidimutans]
MTSLDSYLTLGRSGLRVSPLSLGTMTFGEDYGWGASPATSHTILAEYLEHGGNVVDTANTYTNGHSEQIVGEFFAARPGLRDRIVLSTKFFANLHPGDPNGGGAGRKAIVAQLEESLRRLQTHYVDLYWLHGWDRRVPVEETLRALDDLVAAGKVRYVGFSNVPAWVTAQSETIAHFRGWAPVTALQLEYSLLERTSEGELLPMAEALGLGVLPWSPLRGGQLTGGGSRAALTGGPDEHDRVVIDAVARVAAALGVSAAEVALAWVRGRPAISSTLLGVRTLDQLHSNLRSLALALSPEQRATLDDVSAPVLDFPAAITAGPGPMLGFGGATIDGVAYPTWPPLEASSARY